MNLPDGFIATDLHEADDRINTLKEQLAASQAREQVLREALRQARFCLPPVQATIVKEALALPSDDTALRQWGAKLLREIASYCTGTDDLRAKADELDPPKVYYAGQDQKTPK